MHDASVGNAKIFSGCDENRGMVDNPVDRINNNIGAYHHAEAAAGISPVGQHLAMGRRTKLVIAGVGDGLMIAVVVIADIAGAGNIIITIG